MPNPALADAAQAAPPPGADPSGGAVPSASAGGGPDPSGPGGVLPPSVSPMPGNTAAAGSDAIFLEIMRKITGALHYARGLASPNHPLLKKVDQAFRTLAKDFIPDTDTMKGGQMPPLASVGAGAPPGGPPMAGGPPGAGTMPPPAPPQGPIPMRGPPVAA